MKKLIELKSNTQTKAFDPAHAQRILIWQKNHPKIIDQWEIAEKGYIFDDAKNVIIKRTDSTARKDSGS